MPQSLKPKSIKLLHYEEKKDDKRIFRQGVTLIEYEGQPSKIIQWSQLVEGDPFGEHETTYRINYGSESILRSFKVKYLGREGDKHRVLIKEGVSGCGTKTKRIENKELLVPDKLYQPYPLQQKSEEGKDPNPIECEICKAIVSVLCGLLAEGVAESVACDEACGEVCLIFIEDPVIYGICVVICIPSCDELLQLIISLGVATACGLGGEYLCQKAGLCC
ncbi:hypothetical protein [Sulfuracidifex tepidarius]|uniref:Saposin B-type domain-containing protein n=1 Tax=Sulfuracidifex tepidarius TaxID=1294262 RepID=A0A510DU57_9CREN|nr:hypothetical protein [Sulfuracidifex tepidarius]BBG23763.1 hypothetical protein IC006_1057 [Sulfuracidifex tepidarius]BBG26516.1 hypothetical protein IC007_1030 [Sulfuracidifex tepidarius]